MPDVNTILSLTVDKILVYYDLPQLFIAKDQIDSRYICLLVDSETEFARYISIPVSKHKLNELILGNIDLRTAFESSETGVWYFITSDDNEEFIIQAVNFNVVDDYYLPDAGFVFPQIEANDKEIIQEATEKNNAVVHLSFTDAHNSNSLEIDLLGDMIKLFQGLVKYSYKKATAAIKNRPDLESDKNFVLRAFATSEGSFNIHMQSLANTDLFGNSNVELALMNIDSIIGDLANEQELIENIKVIKGHAIGAYKKILESIIKNNVNLSYKWVSPANNEVHKKRISKQYAERAIEIIKTREELGKEIKEFIGVVKEVDVDNNKWRLVTADDNKVISGKSEQISLSGITVDEDVYKFKCEELIEVEKATLKEKVTYSLLEWSKVE